MPSQKFKIQRALQFFALSLFFYVSAAHAEVVLESTLKDQTSTDLSIYNDNLAMIREIRKADLAAGESEIRFLDVPSDLIPESVQVRSLTAPEELAVREQNYENGLVDSKALLDKFVGQKIKILNWNQFQDRKEILEATLLAASPEPIYEMDRQIYIGFTGTKILPEIPSGFVLKPALRWKVSSKSKKIHNLEASYLFRGIGWKVDYALTFFESGEPSQLTAWATLTNESGRAYQNARLQLVAGRLNQVTPFEPRPYPMMMKMTEARSTDASFQEKSLFEYHAYDLAGRVDLNNRETKQIQFLRSSRLKAVKEYRIDSASSHWGRWQEEKTKVPVQVYLRFSNSAADGLGTALPQGIMRLYAQGAEGRQEFLGEDRIAHTPADEEIKIRAGEAFDLVAEKKQTDYKQLTGNLSESGWEMKIRNRKKEDVTVIFVETLPSNWQMISQSQNFEKLNANMIQFKVQIPKNQEATVRYRLRVGY